MENWIAIVGIAAISALFWLGHWIGGINEHKSSVGKYIDEIREDIKKILRRLPAPTIEGNSPIQLTDLGRSISDDLKALDWVARIAPTLAERTRGKQPFEIQEMCFDYVKDEFTPEPAQLVELQRCAYENAIDIDAVLDVLAVELRDYFLRETAP